MSDDDRRHSSRGHRQRELHQSKLSNSISYGYRDLFNTRSVESYSQRHADDYRSNKLGNVRSSKRY